MTLVLDTLRDHDDDAVRAIFRSTLALGRPFPFASDGRRDHLRHYEQLCLGWYLDRGRRSAAVLRVDESVVGYALVCLDPVGYERWQRGAVATFARSVLPRLAIRAYPTPVQRFYRHRLRDGWRTWRSRRHVPVLAHAHLNVIAGVGGLPGRILADHIDEVCAAAGHTAWVGEINAKVGRRVAGLDRWGATIVAHTPNATLSWLVGAPVERLTIVRKVPSPVGRRVAA
jgi:hypothetical protein